MQTDDKLIKRNETSMLLTVRFPIYRTSQRAHLQKFNVYGHDFRLN